MTDQVTLTCSQLGYRARDLKRAYVQAKQRLPWLDGAEMELVGGGESAAEGRFGLTYWGEKWGSHFWIVDFSEFTSEGAYVGRIAGADEEILSSPFQINARLFQDETLARLTFATLEGRIRGKLGWQDCGFDGRGLESHAVVVMGLADVLDRSGPLGLSSAEIAQFRAQARHGSEYLLACQRSDGSLMNEYYIARDRTVWHLVALATVALARASDVLEDVRLLEAAKASWTWCLNNQRYSKESREDGVELTRMIFGRYAPWLPPPELRSRDVLLLLWAATELYRQTNDLAYAEQAVSFAKLICECYQNTRSSGTDEFYGDFLAWPDEELHQRAWEHAGWGYNCGSVLPDEVTGFINLLELFPGHADALMWRSCLRQFAYGYVRRVVRLSPFLIYPLGNCEGEIRFFGPSWHGFNGVYLRIAHTCMQLARLFGDPEFERIALANVQWVFGLNCGAIGGHEEDPDQPGTGISWVAGIGERSVRSWSNLDGAISSGYCANRQFRLQHLDSVPDSPSYKSTEDWALYTGTWMSAFSAITPSGALLVKLLRGGRPVDGEVVLLLGDRVIEASSVKRGAHTFVDLPRLTAGCVTARYEGIAINRQVNVISGYSQVLVIDFEDAFSLCVEAGDTANTLSLRLTSEGLSGTRGTYVVSYLPDSPTAVAVDFDVPAGGSLVRQIEPGDETCGRPTSILVSGQYSVSLHDIPELCGPGSERL